MNLRAILQFFDKKVVVNTLYIISEKEVSLVIGLVATIYVTRYLGPNKLGVLSYALSITSLLIPFSNFSVESVIVKQLVISPGQKNNILGSGLCLNLMSSMICIITINTVSYFWLSGDTQLMILFLSSILILNSFFLIDALFQSVLCSKYSTIARIVGNLSSSIFKVLLVVFSASLLWFALGQVIMFFMTALLLIFLLRKKSFGRITEWNVDRQYLKSLAYESLPLILSAGFTTVGFKIDQVILKSIIGYEAVGNYAAAAHLSEIWFFLPVAYMSSVFPKLVKIKGESEKEFSREVSFICSFFFYTALTIAIVTLFFGDLGIDILYGYNYKQSADILKIHICSGVFIFIGKPIIKCVIIDNLSSYLLIIKAIGAFINVFLNMLWIPKMGVTGAAYATLVSYAFSSFFGFIIFNKTRPYFYLILRSILLPIKCVFKSYFFLRK